MTRPKSPHPLLVLSNNPPKHVPAVIDAPKRVSPIGVRPRDLLEYSRTRAPGRPTFHKSGAMRRFNGFLDGDTLDAAREIGDGNVSEGLRIAVRVAIKSTKLLKAAKR